MVVSQYCTAGPQREETSVSAHTFMMFGFDGLCQFKKDIQQVKANPVRCSGETNLKQFQTGFANRCHHKI